MGEHHLADRVHAAVVSDEAHDRSAPVVLRVIHGEEPALPDGILPFALAASLGELERAMLVEEGAESNGLAHGWQD